MPQGRLTKGGSAINGTIGRCAVRRPTSGRAERGSSAMGLGPRAGRLPRAEDDPALTGDPRPRRRIPDRARRGNEVRPAAGRVRADLLARRQGPAGLQRPGRRGRRPAPMNWVGTTRCPPRPLHLRRRAGART
ncbi:hypothetical protein HBB16_03900 [Pseudonocardia sp. MCCB 268]|nr:hypothetical protein [Pseudonocardia cytotoxica]